ncbi:MAG: hypothetical protein J5775_01285 [Spirochaetales bacterium]|nr:hypothetical protein [Spirochaetales bacterium]
MLLRELQKRKARLTKLIEGCRNYIEKAPEGSMRKSRKAFYHTKKDDPYGTRIRNARLISVLATKQYYIKVVREAEKELKLIEDLLRFEKDQPIAMIYEKMGKERQSFVRPLEKTITREISDWLQKEKASLPIKAGKKGVSTLRGDFVRSSAEQRIADALYNAGIPYKNDVEFGVDNFKSYWVDFEIMNPNTGKKYYWEHLGMMDKPDYVSKNMGKLQYYASCGLYPCNGLILTFEDDEHVLEDSHIQRIIKDLLK